MHLIDSIVHIYTCVETFCYSAFIDLLIGNGGQTTWRVLLQIFFIFSSEGKKIIQNVQQMKYCALLTLGYVSEMLSVKIFFSS